MKLQHFPLKLHLVLIGALCFRPIFLLQTSKEGQSASKFGSLEKMHMSASQENYETKHSCNMTAIKEHS